MKYTVSIIWKKQTGEIFTDNKYSRRHQWAFDGGLHVAASSSPQVIPLPLSDAAAVDPEEAFVASLSSCHMLFLLSIAATQKYTIDEYEDNAEGVMEKNEEGVIAMTFVTLRPKIIFSGSIVPSAEHITQLHEMAHEKCYIANSVKTNIKIIPAQ